MSDLEKRLEGTIKKFEDADARGSSSAAQYEQQVKELKKQIAKEKKNKQPPTHPALKFGPISQTVASMAVISLGMSVVDLPEEMLPFFTLFSRMTVVAAVSLVSYSAIIWYGYQEALKKLPKEKSEAEIKLAKLLKSKPDRPDAWAHTRSHPSAFLTTRDAPPRIFPFPLGKTRPDAAVKDELWWEGGNAPHVGHFNKPKMPAPPGPPDEETMIARVRKSMEIEKQRNLWGQRIRGIQYLSCIVVTYFLHIKLAILLLCYLIYTTLARELDNMLTPPTSMDEIYQYIDQMMPPRTESQPKGDLRKRIPGGGMTYIYDPLTAPDAGVLAKNANIPIVQVPAPVLMTTENHWYAGPGDPIKKD